MTTGPIKWHALSPEERDKVVCEAVGINAVPSFTGVSSSMEALKVAQKMRKGGFQHDAVIADRLAAASFSKNGSRWVAITSYIPSAICIAALRAKGYTVETEEKK